MASLKHYTTLVLTAILAACGNAEPSDPPGVPRPSWTLHYGPVTIAPGAEPSTCVALDGPTAELWFNGYKSDWSEGMHHFAFYDATTLPPGPPIPCNTPPGNVFLGLLEPHTETPLITSAPEYAGLAIHIEPGPVAANVHAINTTARPLTLKGDVAFYLTEKPSSPSLRAGPIKGNWPPITVPLSLPPHATTEIIVQCKMARDVNIIRAWGHQHAHGVSFDFYVNDVLRYTSTDWEHPPIKVFDSLHDGVLALKVGDRVRLNCIANNDTALSMPVGPSEIYKAEMCALAGNYAPFLGGYFPCR